MSSWIVYYLLQTVGKSLLFTWSTEAELFRIAISWPILPCISFVMKHVCVWICLDFVPFYVTNFHIGNFFIRNQTSKLLYPQMFYLVLDAIRTSPIISYLGTDTNLIWIYLMKNYLGILFFCWVSIISTLILSEQGRGEERCRAVTQMAFIEIQCKI